MWLLSFALEGFWGYHVSHHHDLFVQVQEIPYRVEITAHSTGLLPPARPQSSLAKLPLLALLHHISALAITMAILLCLWRQFSVVTFGKCGLVILKEMIAV